MQPYSSTADKDTISIRGGKVGGTACTLGSCEPANAAAPTLPPLTKPPLSATAIATAPTPTVDPILFWSQDPNVLFQPAHILEFFPTDTMSYNQKLNAISRTVIVLTLISFLYTRSLRLLGIAAITMLAIYLLYFSHHQLPAKEAFDMGAVSSALSTSSAAPVFTGAGRMTSDPNHPPLGDNYTRPVNPALHVGFLPSTSENPVGNVLITDYEFDPTRPPALPAYDKSVSTTIMEKTKEMIAKNHPGQPDIVDKLFGDLGDEFNFEQSMRPFYATANTMIPNDQASFAEFCYGNMVSCKEGDQFACARNGPPRYQQ